MPTELFTSVAPSLALAVPVLVLAAVAAVPLWLWQRRQTRLMELEARRLGVEAAKGREVLASVPDGLFMWDDVNGVETCSGRLATLLGLATGTGARFEDVRARFGVHGAALERAVVALRRDGQPFELTLPVDERPVRVRGARAWSATGRAFADMLWMREERPAAAAPAPERLAAIVDALPLPAWLRAADLEVIHRNARCTDPDLAGTARPLAARALDEGRPLSESRPATPGGDAAPVVITEAPVPGWEGTIGIAVEQPSPAAAPSPPSAPAGLLDMVPVGVAAFDGDTRLTLCNRAFAKLWDLDAEWLDGRPLYGELLDRLRERRRLPEVADFRAAKAAELGWFETPPAAAAADLMHLPDGRSLRRVRAADGAGGLVFTYEDISPTLDLERSVHTLDAVQRASFDNLFEGVAVFGADGRLRLSNAVFAALWNLDADILKPGLHVADFVERMRPFLAIDGREWPAAKGRIVARVLGREHGTGRLQRTDGTVLDYANVPLRDGAVLLIYLDVTDPVEVERALRARADALDEASRLKSEFIANVSYEVRTPLTSVIGFAETLSEGYFGPLNARQKEYAGGILTAARKLMGVLEDILDLAAIEAGTLALDLDTVELHSLLASVLGLIRERARAKALTVEFDCPPDVGWIVADGKRLRQVLFNLLGNAIDFSPERRSIRLTAKREAGYVVLAVSDTGIGIPLADQERVLEPFGRGATPERRNDGAGLGLSLVKRFIDLHGGTVQIRSAPNRGTTVTCRIPVGDVGNAALDVESAAPTG